MSNVVRVGILSVALAAGVVFGPGGAPAQAAKVSGFSVKDKITKKCLKAGGLGSTITLVKCNKDKANQRWSQLSLQLANRDSPTAGWCLDGASKHEKAVKLGGCGGRYTEWDESSLKDGAETILWNAHCGFLKVTDKGKVLCGKKTKHTKWVIDY